MEILHKMAVVFIFVSLLAVSVSSLTNSLAQFDDDVIKYLENNHYKSTALGVMVDGKMVYAKGFTVGTGSSLGGDATKLWPIGRLSESITALAVLKLFQNGDLALNETVFGHKGILNALKPLKTHGAVDDRVYDITVQDLLSHSSGWDSTAAPLLDPALNADYLKHGVNVTDIRDEIGILGSLTTRHIIGYMLNQPLKYQPGSKSVNSVFHSGILAEIVETVSGQDYRKYVKKYILELCGMWSTRLGPRHHPSEPADIDTKAAARGWYSTVYDLLRLMKCIDGSGRFRVLSDDTVRHIAMRDEERRSSGIWNGLGFLTNRHHAVWQIMAGSKRNALLWHSSLASQRKQRHRHVKLSFVFLFESANATSKINRHSLSGLVRSVHSWPKENVFATDLSDVPELAGGTIFKLSVSERHAKAYVNALKTEYYDVTWISAAHNRRATHFSVVSSKNKDGNNYIFECGLARKSLYDHRKLLRAYSYELHFLQSYISQSHGTKYRYQALSKKVARKSDIVLGTRSDNQHYKLIFAANHKNGYTPVIQSVTYSHGNISNDYLFVKNSNDNYKSYINMHLGNMDDVVQQNADANRVLHYLDVTDVHGVPMFSAIFTEAKNTSGVFRKDISGKDLLITIDNNKRHDYVPKIVVGYTVGTARHLKYVLYLSAYKK